MTNACKSLCTAKHNSLSLLKASTLKITGCNSAVSPKSTSHWQQTLWTVWQTCTQAAACELLSLVKVVRVQWFVKYVSLWNTQMLSCTTGKQILQDIALYLAVGEPSGAAFLRHLCFYFTVSHSMASQQREAKVLLKPCNTTTPWGSSGNWQCGLFLLCFLFQNKMLLYFLQSHCPSHSPLFLLSLPSSPMLSLSASYKISLWKNVDMSDGSAALVLWGTFQWPSVMPRSAPSILLSPSSLLPIIWSQVLCPQFLHLFSVVCAFSHYTSCTF